MVLPPHQLLIFLVTLQYQLCFPGWLSPCPLCPSPRLASSLHSASLLPYLCSSVFSLSLFSSPSPSLFCSSFSHGRVQSAGHLQPITLFTLLWTLLDASDCSLSHIYNKTLSLTIPRNSHVVSLYRKQFVFDVYVELNLVIALGKLVVFNNSSYT